MHNHIIFNSPSEMENYFSSSHPLSVRTLNDVNFSAKMSSSEFKNNIYFINFSSTSKQTEINVKKNDNYINIIYSYYDISWKYHHKHGRIKKNGLMSFSGKYDLKILLNQNADIISFFYHKSLLGEEYIDFLEKNSIFDGKCHENENIKYLFKELIYDLDNSISLYYRINLIVSSIILETLSNKECSLRIIKEKIKKNIKNGFLNIKEHDIINDLNLTYYNINDILKKNKITWVKLINLCKVEILFEKIENKETYQSLQELCFASGFTNISSASRLFKLKFGITMKELIKNRQIIINTVLSQS